MKLVEVYRSLDDEFDVELEQVVTYTLTSACYDNDRDYSLIKPIMSYLQDVLIKSPNFAEDDGSSDSIMGLDSILMSGGSQGVRDFMKHPHVENLL